MRSVRARSCPAGRPSAAATDYAALDRALARLADCGPDLASGMTSHAPMAAEALCALGRPQAVAPLVERARAGTLPWPAAREPISADAWRDALARPERVADWRDLFAAQLAREPWQRVLDRWVARLAPGFCAAATHGAIRVGHAARGLAVAETEARRGELAAALASWAYAYQELPTRRDPGARGLPPQAAIARVPLVPAERRHFTGTIVSSLEALSSFADFTPVIDLLDADGDPAEAIPQLAEVFARVYLGSAHDELSSIVFVHGVTSVHALGNLIPHLRAETAREALRYAWQSACALYAAFGRRVAPAAEVEAPTDDDVETLVDRAAAHGDEHVIKLTEACLAQYARLPAPAFLAAAGHALEVLPRA